MNAVLIITSGVVGAIAVISFYIAYRQHKENGYIFTNTWVWASKKERENMDERIKKREYRLARNIFFILGIIFSILAGNILFQFWWYNLIFSVLCVFVCIYAIVRWSKNERLYKTFK